MRINKDEIPWAAIDRAGDYFYQEHVSKYMIGSYIGRLRASAEYRVWMQNNWGIHHEPLEFKIVDEEKYIMFLLRWA
jgi:hypothetical protein